MFIRGPNGTMSLQTMSDIQRLINSLIELNTMVTEENPAFLPEVDLHSFTYITCRESLCRDEGRIYRHPTVAGLCSKPPG